MLESSTSTQSLWESTWRRWSWYFRLVICSWMKPFQDLFAGNNPSFGVWHWKYYILSQNVPTLNLWIFTSFGNYSWTFCATTYTKGYLFHNFPLPIFLDVNCGNHHSPFVRLLCCKSLGCGFECILFIQSWRLILIYISLKVFRIWSK